MRGIEIEAFALALARVTLWMGHKVAVDELELSESTLPLQDLSGLQLADALSVPWPRADAIIGNPPFHGSQNIRRVMGDEYAERLKRTFGIGLKDYCVYWFRRAHDQLEPGGRAGLVGTNSVSQNRARGASLNHIVEQGGVITEAVSKEKWPGEAVVNVSIVNWVKRPERTPGRFLLDGMEVEGISTALRPSILPIEDVAVLGENRRRSFQGPIPAGDFYLSVEEANALLSRLDAAYEDVVRPYLVGDDITDDPRQRPRRFVIDFAMRALEEAMAYPAALERVRERVKPRRDLNNREAYRRYWWRFAEPRPAMRAALAPLGRYIAGNRIGKRFLFCWCEPAVCPSDLVIVFAFEDDYAMGVLSSSVHRHWAIGQSSTLRVDLRYTPTSAFETFPWPEPSAAQRERIAGLARELIEHRRSTCEDRQIGLTTLYNQMDDGAWEELRDLHNALDRAVADAYGWPARLAADPLESNRRLAELNRSIAAGERAYAPFAQKTAA